MLGASSQRSHVASEGVEYTIDDPAVAAYLTDVLIERRKRIGEYWYHRVAPLDDFVVEDGNGAAWLGFNDLGRAQGVWESASYSYELRWEGDGDVVASGTVEQAPFRVRIPTPIASGAHLKCTLRIGHEAGRSQPVHVHIYFDGSHGPRIVRVDRDS